MRVSIDLFALRWPPQFSTRRADITVHTVGLCFYIHEFSRSLAHLFWTKWVVFRALTNINSVVYRTKLPKSLPLISHVLVWLIMVISSTVVSKNNRIWVVCSIIVAVFANWVVKHTSSKGHNNGLEKYWLTNWHTYVTHIVPFDIDTETGIRWWENYMINKTQTTKTQCRNAFIIFYLFRSIETGKCE